MKIIEYEDKYLENVRDLFVELEEYIVSIDKDGLAHIHPEYREKMAILDLEEVNEWNGKCYLAVEDEKAIGLIMGIIPGYYVLVYVFAYNDNAIKFYDKHGYHTRMYVDIKKLD